MPAIRDLLARRTDLSTFVVHLSRDYQGTTAKANLESILRAGRIEARSPFGSAAQALKRRDAPAEDVDSQRCVCFTETPLEHLHLLLADITDLKRECHFMPYGIAITKRVARGSGVNPVWYTDITPTGRTWLVRYVDILVQEALASQEEARAAGQRKMFGDYPIAKLAPFIEQMGSGENSGGMGTYRKEFWWEREWRARLHFDLPDRFIVIAPEAEHEHFHRLTNEPDQRAAIIDARWGLEEIIGRLAGYSADQVGPSV
jgi:hypothetical protein